MCVFVRSQSRSVKLFNLTRCCNEKTHIKYLKVGVDFLVPSNVIDDFFRRRHDHYKSSHSHDDGEKHDPYWFQFCFAFSKTKTEVD